MKDFSRITYKYSVSENDPRFTSFSEYSSQVLEIP